MVTLDKINREEALRYLGFCGNPPDGRTLELIEQCEQELLAAARPGYVYRGFTVRGTENAIGFQDCGLVLTGEDIKAHLAGCEKAVLMCATIGAGTDRLIRKAQVEDMAKAVVLDSLASAAVEQVCDKVEELVSRDFPAYHKTWRFSPGYGDMPIAVQNELLFVLDAQRKAGVCTNASCMLTPIKSVTAVIGLSKQEIIKKKRSCNECNLRGTCAFRKAGTRCV